MSETPKTPQFALSRYKPMPKHWYRIYLRQCPVCGRSGQTRERVYGDPPKDRAKRYVWESDSVGYDGCLY